MSSIVRVASILTTVRGVPMGATLIALIIAISVTTYLVDCGGEDRIVTAKCQVQDDVFSAIVSTSEIDRAAWGRFDGRQDGLGAILRVVPEQGRNGTARWLTAYTLNAVDKSVFHERHWSRGIRHARLDTDLDGEMLAESFRARVQSMLSFGTRIALYDVEQQTMSNVLYAINADPKALSILQGATAQERYLVVSSIAFAKGASLIYSRDWQEAPFVAIQTFTIRDTYFHSNYFCRPLEEIGARANLTKARVPAVYFYTAVRYDDATKSAQIDPRPIDVDLLGTTL